MIPSCVCECLIISQIVEVASQIRKAGTSLVVQWLRLWTSKAGSAGLIPGDGTRISHAIWYGKKKEWVNKKSKRKQRLSWWWTGRPGVLRFTGSQRVGHDWATELNWRQKNRLPSLTFGRDSKAGRRVGRLQLCPGGDLCSKEVVGG